MNETVYQSSPEKEYYFREGCFILELLNDPARPELSIARARVTPGTETRPHRLKGTIERYVIQAGKGRVFLGKDSEGHAVGPGDVVVIAAETTQSIRNDGKEDLVFLAICTPRFDSVNYAEV